ncbi:MULTISPECIES: alpha/beta hydrolase [Catenuloplanes]|uniref:Pimeloyl-ACP methyl ester carboxylesterase n=1 Tax=Catenuloplanes niger TaxID=587534 RepID=A0AAE3ZHZ5_9ACTN|nr:alpha/beta hydrolase [Catenuloplanes niger]MDR7320302.1 pimeloyl-ACP methyl ester carboxylesterase [Catenuloplanes niger]
MNRRRVAALAALLGTAGALIAMPPAAADPAAPALTWAACPVDVVINPLVTAQCATLPVPLDYGDPDGEQIEIMISRVAGPNPAKRRGILLTNPGGPGGSGLGLPSDLVGKGLPVSVSNAYDLIGMDTRGVGHSTPMGCGLTTDDGYQGNIPPYAPDDAAVVAQAEIAKKVAARCAANPRLRHLTTANTARDLDRVRIALGEEKASFLGFSYGSALGAAYASLFPDTADRVVLDSNVGDSHLNREGLRRYALGFEETFPDFARWLADRHDAYGMGRTPEQVRRTYLALVERLDRTPAPDGTTGAMLRAVVFAGLFSEAAYGRTAIILQTYLIPGSVPPAPETPPGPHPLDVALSVFLSVSCNDTEWPEDLDTYRRGVAEDRKRYPLYGAAAANVLPCAYWPWEPSEAPVEIVPNDVLIVQNRHDPVTPLAGGRLLRSAFGAGSRLLTVNGSGHGVYVLGGDACALNVTTAYLTDGRLPARDTVC